MSPTELMRRPLALLWFGVFLYSTGPVMAASTSASGPVLSFWRLWMGAAVLAVLAAVHVRVTGRVPSRRAWAFAAAAGVMFGLHQLLFFEALKRTSVVDVLLVATTSPLVVAAVAVPLWGERMGRPFRVWSLVAMAGAAVVVLAGSAGPEGEPVGMTLALLNVFAFTGFFLLSKQGRDDFDVLPFLFGVMFVAAVLVSGFCLAAAQPLGSMTGHDMLMAAGMTLLPGTLGHFVMTWPLDRVPANVPEVMRLAIPALSGFMAWVFLGEGVGTSHLVGGVVTLAGVAGAVLSPSGRRLANDYAGDEAAMALEA